MSKKTKLAGNKIIGIHTTFIPAAEKLIKWLSKNTIVEAISFGRIKKIRTGAITFKIKKNKEGMSIQVRGSISIQLLRIYIYEHEEPAFDRLSAQIRQKFNKKYKIFS